MSEIPRVILTALGCNSLYLLPVCIFLSRYCTIDICQKNRYVYLTGGWGL